MDVLTGLAQGFALLFAPARLAACAIGLAFGIASGLIPGIGPLGAIVLALTLLAAVAKTFGPLGPLVFIVAFAFGTLQGRALAALAAGASIQPGRTTRQPADGTLLAGTAIGVVAAVATGAFAVYARLHLADMIGPAEIVAAIVFLLLAGAAFSVSSAARALASAVLGLLLALVGAETGTGIPRLTFGLPQLQDGIDLIAMAIGLFVIASLFGDLGAAAARSRSAASAAPTRPVPGVFAAAVASDVRFSLSLIPLLAWLVPYDAVGALLSRVFAIEQAIAGETTVAQTSSIWVVCATLVVVQVAPLVVFRLPRQALARVARLDVGIAAPLIVAACGVAVLSVTRNPNDFVAIRNPVNLAVMFAFGLIGYGMILADLDRGLLLLAFVLGGRLEENVGRALVIWRGDATVFLQRPISAGFLLAGVALLIGARVWRHRQRGVRGRPPVEAVGASP